MQKLFPILATIGLSLVCVLADLVRIPPGDLEVAELPHPL